MFCSNCGGQVREGAGFCNSCGKPVSRVRSGEMQKPAVPRDGKPTFSLRPKFCPQLVILAGIFVGFLSFIFFGFFLGTFIALFFIEFLRLAISYGTFILFWSIFSFFWPLALWYFVVKQTYQKTEYKFYADKMEYAEGFFNIEEKTIAYSRITEVSLEKGALQKKFGLGSIYLATPATFRSGINIKDVENPDQVYEKIKEIVKR